MKLEEIIGRVSKLMDKEDRTDAEFRYILTLTEFGDVGKYLTHDPVLNPNARVHGSKQDEVLAYGQTLAMLFGLMHLRGVDASEAIELGISNWEDADWRKRESSSERIEGLVACRGRVEGTAYVVGIGNPIKDIKVGEILVAKFPRPADTHHLRKSIGVVIDQGGTSSHVAIIAKQYNIPCIVGTGNATQKIESGAYIVLDARGKKGRVVLK